MCYQFCNNFPKPIHKVKNNHKVHAVVTREKKKNLKNTYQLFKNEL